MIFKNQTTCKELASATKMEKEKLWLIIKVVVFKTLTTCNELASSKKGKRKYRILAIIRHS